jgi:hypothetical protein
MDSYGKVRGIAQGQANATGFDYGIEKLGGEFRSFMLPRRENRSGHELRCEVVSPEELSRCQPGHGPKGY